MLLVGLLTQSSYAGRVVCILPDSLIFSRFYSCIP